MCSSDLFLTPKAPEIYPPLPGSAWCSRLVLRRRLSLVAGLAQRLVVALIVGPAIGKRNDVIHLRGCRHSELALTLGAQRVAAQPPGATLHPSVSTLAWRRSSSRERAEAPPCQRRHAGPQSLKLHSVSSQGKDRHHGACRPRSPPDRITSLTGWRILDVVVWLIDPIKRSPLARYVLPAGHRCPSSATSALSPALGRKKARDPFGGGLHRDFSRVSTSGLYSAMLTQSSATPLPPPSHSS